MNCQEFKKRIDEFADGMAEPEWSGAAQAHVDGCSECADAVEGILRMKQSLGTVFASENPSADLAVRVQQAIRDEAATSVSADRVQTSKTFTLQKLIVPLAMAAAVGVVWFGSLLIGSGLPIGGPQSEIEATWVSSVREVHTNCTQKGSDHHAAGLPRDIPALREKLRSLLGISILVPDLSSAGYKLHSADTCRIRNTLGAHLVFERVSDGKLVSLFTIAKQGVFSPTSDFSLNEHAAFICANEDDRVVSWEDQNGTYVFCGEIESEAMKSLAQGLN